RPISECTMGAVSCVSFENSWKQVPLLVAFHTKAASTLESLYEWERKSWIRE
ncbi:hypothetical protein STEG23_037542, partial [Scotinomys teguina]